MKALVQKFLKDESGATAIEYGLIAAGIGARHHRSGQQGSGTTLQQHVR